jgi:hypothetical protein
VEIKGCKLYRDLMDIIQKRCVCGKLQSTQISCDVNLQVTLEYSEPFFRNSNRMLILRAYNVTSVKELRQRILIQVFRFQFVFVTKYVNLTTGYAWGYQGGEYGKFCLLG